MKKHMLLAALLLSVALPASAQTSTEPTPPSAFQGQNGLKYQGESGGIDYWFFENNEDADYLIGQNRADGSVSIGYLFDQNGVDISSAITGFDPMTPADFIPPGDDADTPASSSAPSSEGDLTPLVPEPGIEQDDNRLLENAPEEVRNELLAQLVEDLNKTTTRDEYEHVLLKWREHVRTTLGAGPAPSVPKSIVDQLRKTETKAPDSGDAETPDSQPDTTPATDEQSSQIDGAEATPAILPNPLAQLMPNDPAPQSMGELVETAANDIAFATLSTESRWFALGAPGAPTVYAVIDPTCPYCALTLADLRDDVMSGKLQLRIVLAPLLSPKAEETIAGIMLSESPGQALFENAEARAGRGGQAIQPRNATDLPEDVRQDLQVNRQNVINLGVNQIPYFVWRTDAGIQTAMGVPQDGQFEGAQSEDEPEVRP